MATIGLRDLYRAPITIGTSGAEEYGTPVRMAKAISAELSVEVAEAILYADDGADEVVKEFVSGEITLNVNDLLPADLAALLGQKQDTDKVVYGSDSDEAPYTAIGFRAKKAGGTYKYIWLYKVKFAIPDENYTTKGDSIEFTTPEIVGQFIKRSDGLWKAEHVAEPTNSVAAAWFTSVREPNNAGGYSNIERRNGGKSEKGFPPYSAMSAIKDGRFPIMLDKERHLLFSLNAIDEMQDKFGGFDRLDTVLSGKDSIKNLRWLLTVLLNEGAADDEEPLTEKQVGKLIHTGNFADVKAAIFKSFSMGNNGTPEPPERDEEEEDDEEDIEKNATAGKE